MKGPLDDIILVMVATIGIPTVLAGIATTASDHASRWMLDNNIVVPASKAVIAIPGSQVGFDLTQLLMVIAILLIFSGLGIFSVRRLLRSAL